MASVETTVMATGGVTPRLAIRVGVTGHRALKEEQAAEVASRVREVLGVVAETAAALVKDRSAGYAAEEAVLRLISPVAEGADRIVAREGLKAGFGLQCPLPFFREEYAADFGSEESRREFEELLGRATAVFELDGKRSEASVAYQTVGRVMLEQSDVVIAVWDGLPKDSQGGTARMVKEAEDQEVPVVWIDPGRPGEVRLHVAREGDGDWKAGLAEVLERLLRMPRTGKVGHMHPTSAAELGRCLGRRWGRSALGWVWRGFAGLFSRGHGRGGKKEGAARARTGPFEGVYGAANAAAVAFAEKHRGAFVANAVLGVMAVAFALLVVAAPGQHVLWTWMELACIAGIAGLIIAAHKGGWHQRAIDCRLLAEQLRQMRYLWPLGRVTPVSRPPIHHAFGDPRGMSANWHFRAQVRLVGMASARFTPEYGRECWEAIREEWIGGAEGQVEYHRRSSERHERMEHGLHMAARVLFGLTAVACIGHLVVHSHVVGPWLTLASALLPAGGGAAHAIASHGEFRRLAERSRSMAAALERTEEELERVRERGVTEAELYRAVSPAAVAMIEEVTDWQIMYRKPPIEPA